MSALRADPILHSETLFEFCTMNTANDSQGRLGTVCAKHHCAMAGGFEGRSHEGDEPGETRILGASQDLERFVIKKRKAHSPLKGRGAQSGIRIMYAYYVLTNTVDFIEMYFKGESENEDKEKIKEYLTSI